MKFLLQVRFNGADNVIGELPAGEQQKVTAEFEAIRQSPGVLDGNQLQAAGTAATVRVDDGQTLVTEGPAVDAGSRARRLLHLRRARPRRGDRVRGTDPGRPARRDRRGPPDAGALAMAEFPAPTEGIVLTHFIVTSDVDRVAALLRRRARRRGTARRGADDHRAREQLDHHQRRRAAHRRQADSDARAAARPRPRQQLPQHPRRRHPRRLRAVERPRRRVPHPAYRPGSGTPLLHARPRRPPHRGRPNDHDPNAARSALRLSKDR